MTDLPFVSSRAASQQIRLLVLAALRCAPGLAGILVGLGVPGIVLAAGEPASFDCLIQPNRIVQLGSPTPGVVETISIDRGDEVKSGQVLVRLASGVEEVGLQVARTRAQQVADLRAAERSREYAGREVERARGLVEEKFISPAALDKAQTEADVSLERVKLAKERLRQADSEARLAQAQLARRTIRSPMAGIVTDRFVNVGEFVESRPMLRIVEVDPLRVETVVPATWFGRLAAGAKATIRPETGAVKTAVAEVTVVDQVLDPASNTFRVRLKLPNASRAVPAGSRCRIEFDSAG